MVKVSGSVNSVDECSRSTVMRRQGIQGVRTLTIGTRAMGLLSCALVLLLHGSIFAEQYSSLYGFSLGEPIANVLERLGEPDELIELGDGSKVRIYSWDNHSAAFTSVPPTNDFIYSIQVAGEGSSTEQSLDGVYLGDSLENAIQRFGKPTLSRQAIDLFTEKEVKDTTIHFYGDNYSFEDANGKVSSIKITYDGTLSSDNPADELLFAHEPMEIQKVRDYVLKNDYPERFGDDRYRITVEGMHVCDFGGDGLVEVVALYKPHFLQSPTIVIYQIQLDGSVKRVREALAPGPLVRRGDYFMDSHSLGEAADFTVGEKPLSRAEGKRMALAQCDKTCSGLIVQYRDFFHMDTRSGSSTYIDMTGHEPFSQSRDCSEFEFSQVDAIIVGRKDDGSKTGFIAASVGSKHYFYEITSISKDGFLEKKLTILDLDGEADCRSEANPH